ncbi:MAG: UbiA family prenyltransferase [Nanobdellota archaeon]
MKDYLRLMRPSQWYKNLVIFIAIFFTGQIFQSQSLLLTALGFISLCMVSSSNYIINDVVDRFEDKLHPKKKKRPIASGKVGISKALILSFILLITATIIAIFLNKMFALCIITLFLLTQIYSLGLKKEPVIDILIIGINFVIRAMSGAFIINAKISPWLIVCTFFLALLLASNKRSGEISLLKDKAKRKKQLQNYIGISEQLVTINTAILVIAYSLYSFTKHPPSFMLTLPFFLYGVIYFLVKSKKNPEVAINPELSFLDIRMLITAILMSITLLVVLYV